jgi:hypothetical protein
MRDYVDAKFRVIRPKRRGWRLGFDWRNFLILSAIALVGLGRWMVGHFLGL